MYLEPLETGGKGGGVGIEEEEVEEREEGAEDDKEAEVGEEEKEEAGEELLMGRAPCFGMRSSIFCKSSWKIPSGLLEIKPEEDSKSTPGKLEAGREAEEDGEEES